MKKSAFYLCLFILFTSLSPKADTLDDFQQLMAEQQGKVVYLDFWASWCVPCRRSFPWMNEMQSQYQGKGFVVISVNVDAEKRYAEQFLEEVPASFEIFYDPNGEVAKAFKLKGMPSSFIFNKDGKLVSSHVGFNEEKKQRYQQEIEQLLKQ
ncbi:TlpA family protein disulfide reductase [Thalassotalea ganghwensis]